MFVWVDGAGAGAGGLGPSALTDRCCAHAPLLPPATRPFEQKKI